MSTEKFRRELRAESAKWQQEGVIDTAIYEQLASRYRFEQLGNSSSSRFTAVLLGLGGILLGLGAITLVAANWQAWSRLLRMAVIFSAFLSVNAAGFYLWRRSDRQLGSSWLGNGLLLSGALIMGANIGLVSQMFHQSGSVYGLYLVWGLGVLVMAYSLRLTSLGVLSWILIFMSHWGSSWGGVWGDSGIGSSWIGILVAYLPLLITPLYLPLAHWCRSRVLYGLWGVGLMTMLLSADTTRVAAWSPALVTAVFLLPPALLWVYHSQFWRRAVGPIDSGQVDPFMSIGRSLAIWFLSIAAYGYSFEVVWTEGTLFYGQREYTAPYPFLLGLALLWLLTAYGFWRWFLRSRQHSIPNALWMRTPAFIVVLVVMGCLVFIPSSQVIVWWIERSFVYGVVIANIVLFFIGFAMLHDGTLLGIRHRFWGGMGIVVIGLVSRMFEYDTGLMLKALVLGACGIGIIVAGLWFEKKARRSTALPSA